MASAGTIISVMLCVCAWQAHAAVNCTTTGAGRFADPDDTTCKNYTLCIYSTANTSYVSYDYVCPTTSLFSPLLSQCTASYTCNVTSTSNATNTTACTSDGFIADPTSTNCTSYIQCVQINGTFTETSYTCPDNTFYNPNTTFCETDYNCTASVFSCTAAGRFADTTDSTCQAYFYCVLLSDGTFVEYDYTCPSTSVFNPTTAVCTASYTCPN